MSHHARSACKSRDRRGWSGWGALRNVNVRDRHFGKGPSAMQRRGSARWPFAALRVPCDARAAGPVAELATFAALTALRQPRRVRSRCALRARPPALCFSAAHSRPGAAPRSGLHAVLACHESNNAAGGSRQAVPGRGDLWGDEKRRPGVGARSALRRLPRRSCSSAVSEANAASSAARPWAEHRSAVGAADRPSMSPCRVPPGASHRPSHFVSGRPHQGRRSC